MNFADGEDRKKIGKIVDRIMKEKPELSTGRLSITMDLEAVHCNIIPLRLDDFLNADEFNFWHDVAGIVNNLDREKIELQNCFCPRFAQ
jgi:hypothetical protein